MRDSATQFPNRSCRSIRVRATRARGGRVFNPAGWGSLHCIAMSTPSAPPAAPPAPPLASLQQLQVIAAQFNVGNYRAWSAPDRCFDGVTSSNSFDCHAKCDRTDPYIAFELNGTYRVDFVTIYNRRDSAVTAKRLWQSTVGGGGRGYEIWVSESMTDPIAAGIKCAEGSPVMPANPYLQYTQQCGLAAHVVTPVSYTHLTLPTKA